MLYDQLRHMRDHLDCEMEGRLLQLHCAVHPHEVPKPATIQQAIKAESSSAIAA